MRTFRFILQYIKKHRFQYIAGILTLFVVDFANLYIPELTGTVTDGLAARTLGWDGVVSCLVSIFVLGLTLAAGRFLWRYFLFGASRSIEKELRNDMFGHLEKMSVEYYNEHKTGDLMTRFTSDLNAVRMSIGPAVICVFDASGHPHAFYLCRGNLLRENHTCPFPETSGSGFRTHGFCAGEFFRRKGNQSICP